MDSFSGTPVFTGVNAVFGCGYLVKRWKLRFYQCLPSFYPLREKILSELVRKVLLHRGLHLVEPRFECFV
jgi:hypothetical protein